MTDKRIRMDCPFCGNSKENIQLISPLKGYAEIRCQCGVVIKGHSKQEVIDKWNCRAN